MTQSQLLKEINEQPTALARFLAEFTNVERVAAAIRRADAQYITIATRGTSNNAATYAKYVFASFNRLPVALHALSIATASQRRGPDRHLPVRAIAGHCRGDRRSQAAGRPDFSADQLKRFAACARSGSRHVATRRRRANDCRDQDLYDANQRAGARCAPALSSGARTITRRHSRSH